MSGRNSTAHDFTRLTQQELADVFGVTDRQIRRWTGQGLPRRQDGTYSAPEAIAWRISREWCRQCGLPPE